MTITIMAAINNNGHEFDMPHKSQTKISRTFCLKNRHYKKDLVSTVPLTVTLQVGKFKKNFICLYTSENYVLI